MQLLKFDEIQLKREGSRWVNNATPPFPEYQAAAPGLPPPARCAHARARASTRQRAHKQTSSHVKTQTPTRQRRGNMHMSVERPRRSCCPLKQVCITGIIHAVGANWQKLEEATSNDCKQHKHGPKCRPCASTLPLYVFQGFCRETCFLQYPSLPLSGPNAHTSHLQI